MVHAKVSQVCHQKRRRRKEEVKEEEEKDDDDNNNNLNAERTVLFISSVA
jgi:hypothetical protein